MKYLYMIVHNWHMVLSNKVSTFWMRTKKANIMLMVLFIMFVSSLLGLIVAQYVQHLIQVSGFFQQYYRAYYYAYGGLELGLAQSKFHGYGFQDGVDNDFIFNDYLVCSGGVADCQTDITIKSRRNPIADSYQDFADCSTLESNGGNTHITYSLGSGDAIIIPLFYDTSTGFDAIVYDDINATELGTINPTMVATTGFAGEPGTGTYLMKVIDEDLLNYNVTLNPELNDSPYAFATDLGSYSSSTTNKNYLIIANATGSTKEFCIELGGSNTMVSKYITIDSIGKYGKTSASLSAIKVDQLPSFLGYGTINSR